MGYLVQLCLVDTLVFPGLGRFPGVADGVLHGLLSAQCQIHVVDWCPVALGGALPAQLQLQRQGGQVATTDGMEVAKPSRQGADAVVASGPEHEAAAVPSSSLIRTYSRP